MKKQIRYGVYETASSSIHSLSISNKNMKKCRLKVADDGYVHIILNEYYGKDCKDYTSQKSKLRYICTWLYVYYGCDLRRLLEESPWYWDKFVNAFKDYVNKPENQIETNKGKECLGIMIDGVKDGGHDGAYSYFDHQTCPDYTYDDSNCVLNLYDSDQLINFIFNPLLWLHTDCD